MYPLGEILKFWSAVFLGLSVGVMLTGALVLVPFWRALGAVEFLAWFGDNAQSMAWLAGPLQLGSLLLASGAAVVSVVNASAARERVFTIGAAVFALAVLVPYFFYFQRANASFVTATIALHDLPAELGRWAFWQWVRTALGLGAFGLALFALRCRQVRP